MAKYLILIYGDEAQWDEASHDEQRRIGAGHAAFVAKAGWRAGPKILDSGELAVHDHGDEPAPQGLRPVRP